MRLRMLATLTVAFTLPAAGCGSEGGSAPTASPPSSEASQADTTVSSSEEPATSPSAPVASDSTGAPPPPTAVDDTEPAAAPDDFDRALTDMCDALREDLETIPEVAGFLDYAGWERQFRAYIDAFSASVEALDRVTVPPEIEADVDDYLEAVRGVLDLLDEAVAAAEAEDLSEINDKAQEVEGLISELSPLIEVFGKEQCEPKGTSTFAVNDNPLSFDHLTKYEEVAGDDLHEYRIVIAEDEFAQLRVSQASTDQVGPDGFADLLAAFQSQLAAAGREVSEPRIERHGGVDVGVIELVILDPEPGTPAMLLEYFYLTDDGAWQLECVGSPKYEAEVAEACALALETMQLTSS